MPVGTILAHIDDRTRRLDFAVQVEIPAPVGRPSNQRREQPGRLSSRPSLGLIVAGGARLEDHPVARRRAAALGVDPRNVAGSGIEGSIRLADVERLARSVPERPRHVAGYDAAAMRAAIAAAMSRSKREIPHYYRPDDRPGARSRLARIRQLDEVAARSPASSGAFVESERVGVAQDAPPEWPIS